MAPQARRMALDGHLSDCAQYGRTARSACALLSTTAPWPPHLTIHSRPTTPPRRRRERDACCTEVRSMAPQARRMALDGHLSDCAQYGRTTRSACALLST
eukprot:scaffold5758_cov81-Phaeocystis_antarctica.AAC.1